MITVGVENDRELMVAAPAFAEVTHVAGLEAGVHRAAAKRDLEPIAPPRREVGEPRRLRRDNSRIALSLSR